MKYIFTISLLLGTLLFSDNLKDGVDAYNNNKYKISLTLLEPLANDNNKEAQYYMGMIYIWGGAGVEDDSEKGFSWINKSANNGHKNAQAYLGLMYYNAMGCEQNYEKAFEWFLKAAQNKNIPKQNDGMAELFLGNMYTEGVSVNKDDKQAFHWYEESSKLGNITSQFHLGKMYTQGRGTDKDYEKAVFWYKKAVEGNELFAMTNLGDLYYNGQGIKKDFKQAFILWQKVVAKQGNKSFQEWESEKKNNYAYAQYSLANLYCNGYGVLKNPKTCASLAKSAHNNGYDVSKIWDKFELWKYE